VWHHQAGNANLKNQQKQTKQTFAAYIQFTDALTSSRAVMGANTRFMSASVMARRGIAAGASNPLIGCSPIDVAIPVKDP
jgi:hypothetical protein